jgi:hypothetical protein
MALFTTIDEIKDYIPVANVEDISGILPDIEWAEKMYLIPVLGQDMYDELHEAYHGGGSSSGSGEAGMSARMANLLRYVQMPLIHFAYSKQLIISQVQIDGAGVSLVTDATRKTAFQWQIEDLTDKYALE